METAVEADLQEHEMAQEATSTASSNDEDDDFFSGMDILTAKRAKLSDANFERPMFMKGNHNIMLPGCRRKRLPRDATL
jgi:hypothetical protein